MQPFYRTYCSTWAKCSDDGQDIARATSDLLAVKAMLQGHAGLGVLVQQVQNQPLRAIAATGTSACTCVITLATAVA
jgi:hypothetical protein